MRAILLRGEAGETPRFYKELEVTSPVPSYLCMTKPVTLTAGTIEKGMEYPMEAIIDVEYFTLVAKRKVGGVEVAYYLSRLPKSEG